MKRGINEVSAVMTLEESVFTYIQLWQSIEAGKGVGITSSDLNRNIEHPDKPSGKHSERRFAEMIRGMSSIVESEELWEGQVVFKLREQNSPLDQCEGILQDVISNLRRRNKKVHSSASRIAIDRREFEIIIEDLMAAGEFLRIAKQES